MTRHFLEGAAELCGDWPTSGCADWPTLGILTATWSWAVPEGEDDLSGLDFRPPSERDQGAQGSGGSWGSGPCGCGCGAPGEPGFSEGVSPDRTPPGTMALAASLAQLHAEASCPICLDCLTDPVTTGCGHNFCHACLQQRWEGLRDLFPCPLCLQPCPERSCRRNSQLSHLADAVRQLPSTRAKRGRQGEAPLCEKHSQALSLFCEEDLELLCPQCRLSSEHRHHPLVPVEQAAVCHRRRLKGYLEPLTEQLEAAEKGLEMQVSKSFELHFLEGAAELCGDWPTSGCADWPTLGILTATWSWAVPEGEDDLSGLDFRPPSERDQGAQGSGGSWGSGPCGCGCGAPGEPGFSEGVSPDRTPPGTMALAASLAQLHAEASCPICLDCLTDPVTTGCGHNFCHACLQQRWEGLRDLFPCPLCLQPCPERSCRRNSQLSHLADAVRQLPSTRAKRGRQGEAPLCEKHSQALSLFCEEDLELLCPQCRLSSEHRHHPLVPVEQAAVCHRRRLKGYLEPLTEQLEAAEKGLEMQVSKSFELVSNMENQRSKLHSSFELVSNMENQRSKLHSEVEHFKRFLGTEHDEIHVKLLNEEKSVVDKITGKKIQISDHGSTLKSLLYEITNKCSQTDLDLLTGIERIHRSYENLESPAAFWSEVKKEVFTLPPQYFGLHKMIRTFQVHLTLEPETAHHSLQISQDRKTATFRWMEPNCVHPPQVFTSYPAVLSSEGFDAGRHFWQVLQLSSAVTEDILRGSESIPV
ncbi:hypothetical protein CB1_000894002 [Camelus ferus]|nr:hypothetical protein CB1_000894002 [Camelus ferus]